MKRLSVFVLASFMLMTPIKASYQPPACDKCAYFVIEGKPWQEEFKLVQPGCKSCIGPVAKKLVEDQLDKPVLLALFIGLVGKREPMIDNPEDAVAQMMKKLTLAPTISHHEQKVLVQAKTPQIRHDRNTLIYQPTRHAHQRTSQATEHTRKSRNIILSKEQARRAQQSSRERCSALDAQRRDPSVRKSQVKKS